MTVELTSGKPLFGNWTNLTNQAIEERGLQEESVNRDSDKDQKSGERALESRP